MIFRQDGSTKGEIYCLMDKANGVCKIGLSKNAEQRVANLKMGNPTMEHVIVKVIDKYQAENYLHRRFSNRRVKGEWFKNVSFEEFNEAIAEYNDHKESECLDTRLFYNFLYSTEHEVKNGIPSKAWDKLRKQQLNILVLQDSKINDFYGFEKKMDKLFCNVIGSHVINFFIPYSNSPKENLIYKWVQRTKQSKNITIQTFFPNYDYENHCNRLSIYENVTEVLGYSYGLVVCWTKPNLLYNRIIDFAKSKNINVRVSTIPEIIEQKKKRIYYNFKRTA